jgi:hypothetical protein
MASRIRSASLATTTSLWHRRQDEAARTGGGEIVVDDDAEAVVFGEAREHRLDVRLAAVDGDLKLLAAQAGGVHWPGIFPGLPMYLS